MTGPLGSGSLGDAFINVHANTRPVEKDLEDGLDRAGRGAEPEAAKVGAKLGDTIGDGIEKEVGKKGPDIAKTLGRAIEAETVDIAPDFRYNVRGQDGRFISRAAANIRDEVEEAFAAAGGGDGGFFNKLRVGLADALGAGFNISGRSPLVALLPLVVGAVVGVVGALVQAANGLVAALTTIPALIGAIGLQVGILVLAFKGVGTAIQGAFAATNAKELNEAIKNLTPAAQTFVRSLLPIRDALAPIQRLAQENFFLGLGNAITRIADALKPFLNQAAIKLAWALGYAFNYMAQAFSGPEWRHFLQRIIPATEKWLLGFAPAFATFLTGLVKVADASIPFLSKLGGLLNDILLYFGGQFLNESNLAGFLDWLNSMYETLLLLGPLFTAAVKFIVAFLQQLDTAGGKQLIETLTTILDRFAKLFASEIGWKALMAIINLAIASMYVLTFAIFALIGILAVLQATFEFIRDVIVGGFITAVRDALRWLFDLGHDIENFFSTLDDRLESWIKSFYPSLYNAGRNIMNSLIQGLKDSLGPLKATLQYITGLIPSWKGPEDKDKKLLYGAGQDIMYGLGHGIEAGAMDVMKQLEGFTNGIGGIALSNNNNPITFGSNAVQVNFNGALPTSEQAMETGQAVGTGIDRALSARNTRLAVRSL